jgi:hypothetical protein
MKITEEMRIKSLAIKKETEGRENINLQHIFDEYEVSNIIPAPIAYWGEYTISYACPKCPQILHEKYFFINNIYIWHFECKHENCDYEYTIDKYSNYNFPNILTLTNDTYNRCYK